MLIDAAIDTVLAQTLAEFPDTIRVLLRVMAVADEYSGHGFDANKR